MTVKWNIFGVTETEFFINSFMAAIKITQRIDPHHVSSDSSATVKCTLVQALRLCTGRTAHRGRRCVGLL